MKKRLGALMSAMVVGVLGLLVPVSPAAAEDCGGNLIYRERAWAGGVAVGELVVYYNAANGNNCARFNHLGPSWGVTRPTNVTIYKCSTNNPGASGCSPVAQDSDPGNFAHYAGPVRVNAPNNCVMAQGYIFWNGSDRQVWSPLIGC